ncbi:MAG: T9SS type A sorting domain-containing protein [Bacteroidota bacterium]|nr:T9SS type A sorting domain-containing protein [Bacteroidota bacterium]
MKKNIFLAILSLLGALLVEAQTISPVEATEFCPNIDQQFSVSLPDSFTSITANYAIITQLPYGFNSTQTTFTFNAKFIDQNITQGFKIYYKGSTIPLSFNYTKIRSLTYNNSSSCGQIQPTQTSVSAAICQNVSIPISFANIQWNNTSDGSCFGSISKYDYLIPAGWKIGNATSDGTTWITSNSNVNITTNLLGGDGKKILIRPSVTDCSSGNINNQAPVSINITRPNAPLLNVGGLTAINIYCGDAAARTFTVTNGDIATCITSYEWQVANKGWYDVNGNLITSNITTPTPSLTIYPSCNANTPSQDVTVVMHAGTETFPQTVKVSYINNAPPYFGISGPNEFCTSADYTLPVSSSCGANITWSLGLLQNYPQDVALLGCTTCQTTTLTKNRNGNSLLQATVHFPQCNAPDTMYSKLIGVGTPVFWGWYNSPTNSLQPLNPWKRFDTTSYNLVCGMQTINTTTDITANSTVTWDGTGNPSTVHWTQNGNNLGFWIDNSNGNVDAFFTVTVTNTCGTTSIRYWFKSTYNNCSGGQFLLKVSPNPTSGMLTVETTDNEKISQVKLIDKVGNVKKVLVIGLLNKVMVNVNDLPAGFYEVQALVNKQWRSAKLIKQ